MKMKPKQLFTVLTVSILCFTCSVYAQTLRFALEEKFETWPPAGWTLNPASGNGAWVQDGGWTFGPYYSYQGTYCAMFDNFNYNVDIRGNMTSPEVDLSLFEHPLLSFLWFNGATETSGNKFAKILVFYSENGTAFQALDTITAAYSKKWELFEADLPQTAKYIRIQAISNYGGTNTFVDYIHVGDRPLFMPSNLNVDFNSIKTRSADVRWDSYDNVTTFEIVSGLKGFDPETSTPTTVTTTVHTLTELEPNSEYEFYVRSVYPNGSKSDWSFAKSFKTLPTCPPVTDLTATVIDADRVEFSWIEKGDARQWNIEWGPEGFVPGTGTTIHDVTSNPYTAYGLPSGSFLEAYVRGICAEGDTAAWSSKPVKFATACTDFSLPYYEDFKSAITFIEGAVNWVYRLANPCWQTKSGKLAATGNSGLTDTKPSYSSWFGVPFANRPDNTLAMRGDFEGERAVWLISPSLDLGDGSQSYVLQFDVALTYTRSCRPGAPNADDDRFAVLISTDDGATWNNNGVLKLWDNKNSENVLKAISNYGEPVTIDLAGYTGKVKVAFYMESSYSNYYDYSANNIFIDNFAVREQPADYLVALPVVSAPYPVCDTENEVKIKVYNGGTATQKDFDVELIDEHGNLLAQTKCTKAIYPLETVEIPLKWIPTDKGIRTLKARISIANEVEPEKSISYPVQVEVVRAETSVNQIGTGRIRSGESPMDFFNTASISQIIYYENELSSVGVVTAVKFSHIIPGNLHLNVPIKVRIGTTKNQEFASASAWITPDSLSLVYDHVIDTIYGEKDLLLTFDKAYTYQGGNLVIMIEKSGETPAPSVYTTGEDFWHSEDILQRKRVLNWSGNEANPGISDDGALRTVVPNTTIYIDSMSAGRIRGSVSETNGKPLAEATVELTGTSLSGTTDPQGTYEINRVLSGTYHVKASKFGYIDSISPDIRISEMEIVTVNFALKKLPVYQVRGKIISNNGEPLRGVSLFLEGYENYEVSTISDGSYVFYNVYDDKTYTLRARLADYTEFDTTISLSGQDVVLDIVLNELTHPAIGFRPDIREEGKKMSLVWNSPATMTQREVTLDDGSSENGISFTPYQEIRTGNLFKSTGERFISSVRLYGESHEKAGSEAVTLEIYNSDRILQVTSEKFVIPAEQWIEVALPHMVRVEGDYYVIVCWGGERENHTNYLCADENGPHAKDSLTYYIGKDGTWLNMVKDMSAPPMVYMIRPLTYIAKNNTDKAAESFKVWKVEPGKENAPDSWTSMTPDPIRSTSLEESNWSSYETGSIHKYAIRTYYAGGIASPAVFCEEVVKEAIIAPSDLRVSVIRTSVSISWAAPTGGTPLYYVVKIDEDAYLTNKTLFSKQNMTPGIHKVKVYAQYHNAASASLTAEFYISGAGNENTGIPDFTLYPNPAKSHTTLSTASPVSAVRIYNLQGHCLLEIRNPALSETIPTKSLAKGLYIVEISDIRGNSARTKLIVTD